MFGWTVSRAPYSASRRLTSSLVLGLLAAIPAAAQPAKDAKKAEPPENTRFTLDQPFDMENIKLEMTVDVAGKQVDSEATLSLHPTAPARSVTLDAAKFNVKRVMVAVGEGQPQPVDYSHDGRTLDVYFGKTYAPGTALTITVDYQVKDPENGLHFFGPTEDDPDAPLQVWSQGESIDNRYWVPCFDHPNEKQTSEVIVTVDDKFTAVSNGALVEKKPGIKPGTTTYSWKQSQPHAAYLMTLVVGSFAMEQETWRNKPVLYYGPNDRKDELKPTFANTPKMLDFFSDKLGVEYAWDKYAQVCCYQFGGGMENTSATTLGENALLDERARLDGDMDGLISHELAHQWFGDLTTCKEWAHLWLNEGFASYFEALWDEHHNGEPDFAVNMWQKARSAIDGGRDKPIVYRAYAAPDEQFDSRAYPKGAWVVHMLRCRVGDETFWKSLNLFLTTNAHKSVETDDLRRAFEQTTGRSFDRYFYDWTERAGAPAVEVSYDWNDANQSAEVTVRQTQDAPAWVFPLQVEFSAPGMDPVVAEREMTGKEMKISQTLPKRPTLVRVDPHQAVLMDLTEKKGRDLWITQLTDDPSPVGRIRAVREISNDKTDATRNLLAEALKREKFAPVRDELAEKLGDLGGNAARDALLAGVSDPDPKMRRACLNALQHFPGDESVKNAVRDVLVKGDQSYQAEAAAISTYGKIGGADIVELIKPRLGTNSPRDRTRSAALGALSGRTEPEALKTLTEMAKSGPTPQARTAAISSLGESAKKLPEGDAQASEIVATLTGCLDNSQRRVQSTAANELGDLGKLAKSALPDLRKRLADNPSARLKTTLEKAIEKIGKDQPAPEQLGDVRDQLEKLRKENQALKERIETLEARSKTVASGN